MPGCLQRWQAWILYRQNRIFRHQASAPISLFSQWRWCFMTGNGWIPLLLQSYYYFRYPHNGWVQSPGRWQSNDHNQGGCNEEILFFATSKEDIQDSSQNSSSPSNGENRNFPGLVSWLIVCSSGVKAGQVQVLIMLLHTSQVQTKWKISSSLGKGFSRVLRRVHQSLPPTQLPLEKTRFYFSRAELLPRTFWDDKEFTVQQLQVDSFS